MVLTLDGSAGDVGLLNAARWAPFLVLGLLVGAVVDGRRRLPLLVGTDLLQAVLLLSIPLLWWLGALSLPALLVVVVGYGTAAVVNAAASMSLMPRLVPAVHLQPAHARIDGADAVAGTAGPALGGLLVSLVGAPLAVLVDSLSYLCSALMLRRITLVEPAPRTGVTLRGELPQPVVAIQGAGGAFDGAQRGVWVGATADPSPTASRRAASSPLLRLVATGLGAAPTRHLARHPLAAERVVPALLKFGLRSRTARTVWRPRGGNSRTLRALPVRRFGCQYARR